MAVIIFALLPIAAGQPTTRSASQLNASALPPNKAGSFQRVPTQFIAALGDPSANVGLGAAEWGLWRLDPGPRGVPLREYARLEAAGGVASAGWTFSADDWWLEENGRIMERPARLPPGRYLVTGDREVTTVLAVGPTGEWALADGASLYDVTHLPCRSARYRRQAPSATPGAANLSDFPVAAGARMPQIRGFEQQDYAVVFVVGVEIV